MPITENICSLFLCSAKFSNYPQYLGYWRFDDEKNKIQLEKLKKYYESKNKRNNGRAKFINNKKLKINFQIAELTKKTISKIFKLQTLVRT